MKFATYLENSCSYCAKGKFKGRLYDIGEYPGAIADDQHSGYVYGSIFMMSDEEQVLKYLDSYEGFGLEQEQPNLFVRDAISINSDKGPVDCWCYLYNLPVEGFKLISSGDYSEK